MKEQPLKASISASASYRLGDPILITFEIENIGNETYQLLKWGTPLEKEVRDDFLILQRDGETIPYDGVLVKRGDPSQQSYVLIEPGEKLKETVDISITYPIHEPGDYTATLKTSLFDVFPITGASKQAPRRKTHFEPLSLNPSTVQFEVVAVKAERIPKLTSGELAREAEKRTKRTRKAKGPSFNGGTSVQQTDTITAHNNAQRFAALCANQLNHTNPASANALYKTWFGAFEQSRYDNVTRHFTDIANMLQKEHVNYDFTGRSPFGDRCFPGDCAFTYKGVSTVWLCSSYVSAAQIGMDCKFGVLCHEWTHAVSYTEDNAYGESDCQTLATDDPEKAANNADNHEYFAENLAQS
jgi:hypothetical protein